MLNIMRKGGIALIMHRFLESRQVLGLWKERGEGGWNVLLVPTT